MNNTNNKNYAQLTPLKMESTDRLKSIDDQSYSPAGHGHYQNQNGSNNKFKLNPILANINPHGSKKDLMQKYEE